MNGTPQIADITKPAWPSATPKESKLQAWVEAKAALDAAKDYEATCRQAVVAAYPFDPTADEGTQRLDLANGWQLKVVKKLNYNLDKERTDAALDKLEQTGENGKFVAERLVKWSPDLSISEYRLLSPEHKAIIDSVLTTKPGLPTLELVEPKGKK